MLMKKIVLIIPMLLCLFSKAQSIQRSSIGSLSSSSKTENMTIASSTNIISSSKSVKLTSPFVFLVDGEEIQNEIIVFPNPAYVEINCKLEGDGELTELSLSDLSGKELMKTTSDKLNIEQLSSGTYLIKARDSFNRSITKKVIIQK